MASFVTQFIVVSLLMLIFYWWQKSSSFRCYVKYIYYGIIVMSTSATAAFFGLLRPKDIRNIRPISILWTFFFKIFGHDIEVRDEELLKSEEPYVCVSNHQSCLDVIGMMRILPERCTVLAKRELLWAGTFGVGAWLCGLIFIDRLNPDSARETMEKTAKALHDRKLKLWIFPEGTRNMTKDGMISFKKGAFHLAIQAQIPIVPIVYSSYKHWLSAEKKIFNPGKIIIKILPSVPTAGLGPEDVDSLTERVRQKMLDVYWQTSKEVDEWAYARGDTQLL